MKDAIHTIYSFRKSQILEDLKYNANTYLAPSTVCNQVGVFALIPIKEGTVLFRNIKRSMFLLTWEDLKEVDSRVVDKVISLSNVCEEGVYVPDVLHGYDFSFFVNHSDNPNVVYDESKDEYTTLRNIEEGEEILCEYFEHEKDW